MSQEVPMTFTEELVASQQGRLADLGYYSGRIDGKPFAATQNAMSRFKAANGLRDQPFPGPVTMNMLWSHNAKPATPPQPRGHDPAWLSEARNLLGTRESPGEANNPIIMKWARDLDQWYPGDDVPWCGLFVAHCMIRGAPQEPQAFNRLGARNWLKYGAPCEALIGAVTVFWRTHPTKSWDGHVAILTAQNEDAVRVIGGNQSNNVTETWISRDRLLGFRAPTGFTGVQAPDAETGKLSQTEA